MSQQKEQQQQVDKLKQIKEKSKNESLNKSIEEKLNNLNKPINK